MNEERFNDPFEDFFRGDRFFDEIRTIERDLNEMFRHFGDDLNQNPHHHHSVQPREPLSPRDYMLKQPQQQQQQTHEHHFFSHGVPEHFPRPPIFFRRNFERSSPFYNFDMPSQGADKILDGDAGAKEVKGLFTGDGMDDIGLDFPAKKKQLVPKDKLEVDGSQHIKAYRFASGPHGTVEEHTSFDSDSGERRTTISRISGDEKITTVIKQDSSGIEKFENVEKLSDERTSDVILPHLQRVEQTPPMIDLDDYHPFESQTNTSGPLLPPYTSRGSLGRLFESLGFSGMQTQDDGLSEGMAPPPIIPPTLKERFSAFKPVKLLKGFLGRDDSTSDE